MARFSNPFEGEALKAGDVLFHVDGKRYMITHSEGKCANAIDIDTIDIEVEQDEDEEEDTRTHLTKDEIFMAFIERLINGKNNL